MIVARDHLSPLALSGEPPYFHKNPPHIKYDFDQGAPDPAMFPVGDLMRIAREVIDRDGPSALDYTDDRYGYADLTMGWTPLRAELATWISARDGVAQDPNGIIVTNGSVQALALASVALLTGGDAVFVEAATFPFGLRYFEQTGATVVPVRMDRDGLDPADLASKVKEARADGLRPRVLYTIATHQLPTGTVLPLDRRHAVMAIANDDDLVVIEDFIYAPFRYDGDPLPSLYSLDTEGRVLQSDSFAKTVAPGTRLGWMAGSPELILGLAMVRQDLGPNQWLSKVMADYLAQGLLAPQIERSIACYRPKRDTAAAALAKHCADAVDFLVPPGGFYFWLDLDPAIDWERVQSEAYDRGIAMRPGEMFMGQTRGKGHVRMAFSQCSIDLIEEGMAAFGEALKSAGRS